MSLMQTSGRSSGSRRRKSWIFNVLVGVFPLIYLTTAVILGGGNSTLVFRAFHGGVPFYGGGEEGSWRRAHPNQPDPWWHTGAFTRLVSFDDEAKVSFGALAYTVGYYATILSLVGLIVFRALRRFRRT